MIDFRPAFIVTASGNRGPGPGLEPGNRWRMTELCTIRQDGLEGWHPIAESGDLCPTSRTSLAWPDENQKGWPIKPDIVMEGGNYAELGGHRSSTDDLSMLTTILHPSGRLFDTTRDTSPATALAARFAAILWRSHSEVLAGDRAGADGPLGTMDPAIDGGSGDSKQAAQRRLHCYGYGVPDLHRAIHGAVERGESHLRGCPSAVPEEGLRVWVSTKCTSTSCPGPSTFCKAWGPPRCECG